MIFDWSRTASSDFPFCIRQLHPDFSLKDERAGGGHILERRKRGTGLLPTWKAVFSHFIPVIPHLKFAAFQRVLVKVASVNPGAQGTILNLSFRKQSLSHLRCHSSRNSDTVLAEPQSQCVFPSMTPKHLILQNSQWP